MLKHLKRSLVALGFLGLSTLAVFANMAGTFNPILVSPATRLSCTGGTLTTPGGDRVHTFTTFGSNTLTCTGTGTVSYLIVGGGAGGGASASASSFASGAGGGGGGVLLGTITLGETS